MNLGTPHRSEVVDISGGAHTFTLKVQAIYCGAAGTVVAKLRGDGAARTWKGIAAGSYLYGDFESVSNGGAGTTLTAANDMIGVRFWAN
jgi:hypothetical protein